MLGMMPGMGQMRAQLDNLDEREFDRIEAMVRSMTPFERTHSKQINGSRRARIARGSGVEVSEVNALLERFTEAQKMMKQLARGGGIPGMPGMPGLGGGKKGRQQQPQRKKSQVRQPGQAGRRGAGRRRARAGRPHRRRVGLRCAGRRRATRPTSTSCRPASRSSSGGDRPGPAHPVDRDGGATRRLPARPLRAGTQLGAGRQGAQRPRRRGCAVHARRPARPRSLAVVDRVLVRRVCRGRGRDAAGRRRHRAVGRRRALAGRQDRDGARAARAGAGRPALRRRHRPEALRRPRPVRRLHRRDAGRCRWAS